jgi:hypothetical protein
MRHIRISIFLLPLLLVVLPMAGLLPRGESLAPYIEFPPLTRYVQHAPFSWPAFILLALLILAVLFPFCLRYARVEGKTPDESLRAQPFPWWGYGGFLLTMVAWCLAWNRFAWFGSLQPYTFFPLWLGYIISVNSLTCSRTGTCLLINRSRFFLALFPASALFWWFFEYLNRFVQNWYYLGVEHFSPVQYIIHASLCFSTVLPAVQSTAEFLATFPRLVTPLHNWRPVTLHNSKIWGWILLLLSAVALAGISILPDYLFSMLWVAPFLIITGVQAVCVEKTLFHRLPDGDWRLIWLPAMAALICGFFWEMWNYKSLAHWEYSVPFVQRFHIFEMPILGYAGYLPFGLECMAVSVMLDRILGTGVYSEI